MSNSTYRMENDPCLDGAHEWGPWHPRTSGADQLARVCRRCALIERNYEYDDSHKPPLRVSHREFVGAAERYDIISAMTFNLLTLLGLREHHRVLDIGCGSLRIGRLLIPYLNVGNYVGFEPNRWLVTQAIEEETGRALLEIRKPRFIFADTPEDLDKSLRFDYVFAQGVFCHAPLSLVRKWIETGAELIEEDGVFAVSFYTGDEDYNGEDWIYPGHIFYRMETMEKIITKAGFRFVPIKWRHPHGLEWVLMAKPGFDLGSIVGGVPQWNRKVELDPAYRNY